MQGFLAAPSKLLVVSGDENERVCCKAQLTLVECNDGSWLIV